eukprot:8120794-Pyramimonas_sp.AAC.1
MGGDGPKRGPGDGAAAAVLEVRVRVLRAGLGRAAAEVEAANGLAQPGAWQALGTALAEFTTLWGHLRREANEKEAAAGELFMRRTTEANKGLYHDDEEAAMAAALAVMPDHTS